jgi:AsmA protein
LRFRVVVPIREGADERWETTGSGMKRIAVATVTVVALLAMLVAALPFVVPGEFLRSLVAAQISAWTGRSVTVAGEPHLSVYPDLAITVDNVTVNNPEGMNGESFVTADGVRASIRILPLLIGRAEFDEFELVRPRFRLIVGKDGSTNWRMAAAALAAHVARATGAVEDDERPANGENGAILAVDDMRIGRLKVNDGIVLYDDLSSERREELTDVDLEVVWPSVLAAARVSGATTWRGERIEFNGSIADPVALIAGGTSPTRFAAATTIFRGSFTGEASTAGRLQLDGRAIATTPSLRRAIAWSGTPMAAGAILGTASIEGAVSVSGRTIAFKPATIELDGNRAEGAVSFVLAEPRMTVEGTLATERLDLSPYYEASRADIARDGSWLITPTSLDFADAIDADVQISAATVLIGATRLGSVAAGITVRGGAIGVDITQGQFYGGKFVASLGAGMLADNLVAGAEVEMSGVPARVALADLAGIDALDGTAALSLSIQSRGARWGEFVLALGGTGALSVTRGVLTGIDVVDIARTMADPLAQPIDAFDGATAFSSLAATLAIGDGGFATDNLTMKGNGYSLTLKGKASLINGLVEGTAEVAAGGDIIPLKVSGRWRAPTIARDTAPATPVEQVTTHDEAGAATGG